MALEMMRKNGNCQGIDKQEQRLVWIDCEVGLLFKLIYLSSIAYIHLSFFCS
jgi:hypothetical protein